MDDAENISYNTNNFGKSRSLIIFLSAMSKQKGRVGYLAFIRQPI